MAEKKPKTLAELTDAELSAKEAELSAERTRRREEAAKAKALRHTAHEEKVKELLTLPVVDAFAPTHGRTSCSDTNRPNGVYGDDEPRCTRCALLDIVDHGYVPDHLWVRLSLNSEE